jgi:Restriction endonuclease
MRRADEDRRVPDRARAAALTGDGLPFRHAAGELRRQELARFAAAVTPRIEAFRSMTRDMFRAEIAAMLERLGHTLISAVNDIVTTKDGRKYITACADPLDRDPVKAPALRRLHDIIVSTGAARGFSVTPRSFTPEAGHYAESAPIDLVDGALLIRSMHRSRKGIAMPTSYKAMCCQCGGIVQHQLGKDEALPCANGHLVAPTIARADLVPFRAPPPEPGAAPAIRPGPVIKPRNTSLKAQRRRAIRARNRQVQRRTQPQRDA